MSDPLVLQLADAHDASLVGGKAVNLSRLINAGFRVPGGFVVTTAAFRSGAGREPSDETRRQIVEAYQNLGSPMVAVRSSATAEDMADASMAGQYETFLNIEGEADVVHAVIRCWHSIDTARTRSYLEEHGIAFDQVAMAVVVQGLVPADVAGVLFTANPRTGSRDELVIDASYGLGESVVSGTVQPDSLILERATGRVKSVVCGSKETLLRPGQRETEAVDPSLRSRPCLDSKQVHQLWLLGLKIMEHFGSAQDAEWAIHDGQIYLLQSRAITTLEGVEARAECLRRTRLQLRQNLAAGRGAWVRHNISETLPHPSPLTWSVVRRFMSGAGGFGNMYRMVGFEPAPLACEEGFLDLIAGRAYMDLSRAPEMFFESMPFRYDIDLLRTNPDAAQSAPTVPAGSFAQQWKMGSRLGKTTRKLRSLAEGFDEQLEGEIIPDFVEWVKTEKARDLSLFSTAELISCWEEREKKVMDDFAPASLLPSLITAMALDDLRKFCAENFWDEDSDVLSTRLAVSPAPDSTTRSAQGLLDVCRGEKTLQEWIETFGHRAPEEFDLATPRWRERPEAVATLAGHLEGSESPVERQAVRLADAEALMETLGSRLSRSLNLEMRKRVAMAGRYLRFREDGKFFLMQGYDLLRDLALEAGKRLDIGDRVFSMNLEELRDAMLTGFAPLHLLDQRQIERSAEESLSLPHVITVEEIETLGEPVVPAGGDRLPAFSISSGVATGPARIVFSPTEAGDLGAGYILVCPSTDPNWTPLFVKAAGLIIERGGTLSHGAVVAREMGLPAVVFDGATQLIRDGESVTVDAQRGAILRASDLEGAPFAPDADDVGIPIEWTPPPPGDRERNAARLRNIWLAIWAVFLAAVFLFPPAWLHDPALSIIDFVLWPLVAWLGKPLTVAAVAIGLAVVSMVGQRILTDNRRLLVAKKRASILQTEAKKFAPDCPRGKALLRLAALVQTRIMMASFVPLAVILGPMVMIFSWLPARVDPASANAKPGSDILVIAKVAGDFTKPLDIVLDPPLVLTAGQKAEQALQPIRATLGRLLSKWKLSPVASDDSWELLAAGAKAREEMLADLSAYLASPLPPRDVSWTVKSPPDLPGRFAISVASNGDPLLTSYAILGDLCPPPKREDIGDGKGPVQITFATNGSDPIRSLRLQYRQQKVAGESVFLRPFEAFGVKWDAGWLLIYIAVYIPVMMFLRWILRIA